MYFSIYHNDLMIIELRIVVSLPKIWRLDGTIK